MTAEIFEDGTIYTYKGDTIIFDCNNVPTDLEYTVYFSIKDTTSDEDLIDQIPFIPVGNTVTIEVKPYITDLIQIPIGKKFKDARYALKACNELNGVEHTLSIGSNQVGTENKIRFYREQSKGTIL